VRAFAMGLIVGEFYKMPVNPTNSDLAKGQERLHECLEAHIASTSNNFTTTRKDILRIRKSQITTNTNIRKISGNQVEVIQTLDAVNSTVSGLSAKSGAIDDKFEQLNRSGWKAVGAIALAVFIAFLGVVATNFNHTNDHTSEILQAIQQLKK
jgi:hypothetical protein